MATIGDFFALIFGVSDTHILILQSFGSFYLLFDVHEKLNGEKLYKVKCAAFTRVRRAKPRFSFSRCNYP